MALTLTDILEGLHSIFESLHKFEQRYLLASEVFYELYMQGLLDDGSYAEEFAEWAGHCKLRQKRETALKYQTQPQASTRHQFYRAESANTHIRFRSYVVEF